MPSGVTSTRTSAPVVGPATPRERACRAVRGTSGHRGHTRCRALGPPRRSGAASDAASVLVPRGGLRHLAPRLTSDAGGEPLLPAAGRGSRRPARARPASRQPASSRSGRRHERMASAPALRLSAFASRSARWSRRSVAIRCSSLAWLRRDERSSVPVPRAPRRLLHDAQQLSHVHPRCVRDPRSTGAPVDRGHEDSLDPRQSSLQPLPTAGSGDVVDQKFGYHRRGDSPFCL